MQEALKILMVEDAESDAQLELHELRRAGLVIDVRRVETERVDIVLMDFRLPGTDGVDGTRMVLERSPQTSVVMVSGFDDLSHRSAARKAGARAFVCKRAISRELIPVIASLVNCEPQPSRSTG